MSELVGGVEAGGTKFVCAVGTGPDDIRAQTRIETTTPHETLAQVVEFFRTQQSAHTPLQAIGIGSFGPVDPNPTSPTFGFITNTPKPGWQDTNMAGALRQGCDLPVAFDTDVNAAAFGEGRWGAARELDTFLYLTIGTGIGGGGMANGRLMRGLIHPEMGHIRIPHDLQVDPFAGDCPFHGDCLEGLASGSAMAGRWGMSPEDLPNNHPAWDLEATYLALALVNFICTLSPQRVILGGGVMNQDCLYGLIRGKVARYLNDYIQSPAVTDSIDQYIVPPTLRSRAGVLGAMALAQQLLPTT